MKREIFKNHFIERCIILLIGSGLSVGATTIIINLVIYIDTNITS
ncbi:hypothetical protein R4L22_05125 [Brachyspira pilosicoli]|nr:hypothetical protein [Brachyspira pilosicoli]